MTCFMKKMKYLEKIMRNGRAWSCSEVNVQFFSRKKTKNLLSIVPCPVDIQMTVKEKCFKQWVSLQLQHQPVVLFSTTLLVDGSVILHSPVDLKVRNVSLPESFIHERKTIPIHIFVTGDKHTSTETVLKSSCCSVALHQDDFKSYP